VLELIDDAFGNLGPPSLATCTATYAAGTTPAALSIAWHYGGGCHPHEKGIMNGDFIMPTTSSPPPMAISLRTAASFFNWSNRPRPKAAATAVGA
jgi:hypothetical protein